MQFAGTYDVLGDRQGLSGWQEQYHRYSVFFHQLEKGFKGTL